MIEISAIKAIVDLFKDTVGLIDKHHQNKREMFERTFNPTFERLESVAKEYYAIVSDTRLRLGEPDPKFSEILAVVRQRRAAVVIARDGILGEATAFRRYTYRARANLTHKARAKLQEYDELAFNFVTSIESCFSH